MVLAHAFLEENQIGRKTGGGGGENCSLCQVSLLGLVLHGGEKKICFCFGRHVDREVLHVVM